MKDGNKKTTVILPKKLLDRAVKASGKSITGTIRTGLELVAAKAAYEGLRSYRGRYKPSISLKKLRSE